MRPWLWVIVGGVGCVPVEPERVRSPVDSEPAQPAVHTAAREPTDPPPNVLIVLIDDLGADGVGAFGGSQGFPTPQLDAFAADAVRFQRAYAAPVCSPTRAELLTGRWSHRTGVTTALDYHAPDHLGLDPAEVLLPEALRGRGYTSVALGKWHLGTALGGGPTHPLVAGFDHHRGALANIGPDGSPTGEPMSYGWWEKSVDGNVGRTTTYVTTDTVDDAVAWVQTLPEPWFVYVALNAPHAPWHVPPDALHSQPIDQASSVTAKFTAMVEATDRELGRLFAVADPTDTWIAVLGDNGTPTEVVGAHGKASVFEGGVHVPLAIQGPGALVDRDVEHLVAAVDLFPTALGWAGLTAPEGLDGLDLGPLLVEPDAAPVRTWVYSGRSTPAGDPDPIGFARMVRDDRFKLTHTQVAFESEVWGLYDLETDPEEQRNLLETGQVLAPVPLMAFERLAQQYQAVLTP